MKPSKLIFLLCSMIAILGSCSSSSSTDNTSLTGDSEATTNPNDTASLVLKVGLIADIQYCDCDFDEDLNRAFGNSDDKLSDALQNLNDDGVDFTVTLGDAIDRFDESYDVILPILNNSAVSNYHTLGNHEYDSVSEETILSLEDKFKLENNYYSFSQEGWRFIFLDGTEVASYSAVLRPEYQEEFEALYASIEGQPNYGVFNGGISQDQLIWLEDQILTAKDIGERVVIFCHFPIYPANNSFNLFNHAQVRNLIEQNDHVLAYINGHDHSGEIDNQGGTLYATIAGMVKTQETNSYGVLEIYTNRLEIRGEGLVDDFTFVYR